MNFYSLSACHRHPQEQGVGVCSACLAQRLVSLAQPRHLPAEDAGLCRRSDGSPPQSPSPQSALLQAIAEEEDSAGGEARHESSDFAILKPSCARNPDDVAVRDGENRNGSPLRDGEEAVLDGQEALSDCEKGNRFDEMEAIVEQEISEVQLSNTEIFCESERKIFCGSERKFAIDKAEESAEKEAKWKRSNSLGALGAASIKHVPRISSSRGADRSAGGKKVSLRSLLELDDAERQEIRSLESALAKDAKTSHNCMHNAEELFKYRVRVDEKPNDLATPCHHSNDLLCWSCRALLSSSASIASSVCSARINKQPVWLNAFLCRKTTDEKASRVHEFRHQSLFENAHTRASIDNQFFRSIYIASESRVSSMRSSGSRIKFHAVRNLLSSSEPTSPAPFRVDSQSELKFNLTARVLAIDVPSMFQAGIRQDESATSNSGEQRSSCQEGCNQGPSLPVCDGLSIDRIAAMRPSEMKVGIRTCNAEFKTDSESPPKMREEELAEHESTLLTTPSTPAGMALDAAIPSMSRKPNRIARVDEHTDDDATETELIRVCQRVVESHHRCRPVRSMSPCISYATATEAPFDREIGIQTQSTEVNSGAEEEGPTKEWVVQQGKELVSLEARNDAEPKKAKERTTGYLGAMQTGYHEAGEGEDPKSGKTEQSGEIEHGEAGQVSNNREWGREYAERSNAGQRGEAEPGEAVQTEFDEAGEEEVANCGRTWQWGETAHEEAGQTKSGRTGQLAETEHGGEGQAGQKEAREAEPGQGEAREGGSWQRVGMDWGEAGEAKEITELWQVDSRRSASWSAERAQQQHQQQQQQEIWEPYCKSSKASRSSSRMSSRWQPPSCNVQIVPDHPLLRFYLTPLRSNGRMRSRRLQSPKRHLWPLVFV